MLTEICGYLHNWFCEDSDIIIGTITVGDGSIAVPYGSIQPGQYIRIVGSVFNDGVIQYGTDELVDETFEGAVWPMKVPKAVIAIAEEITQWQEKYGGYDNKSMSPYNSESFAGYSYSKSGGDATTQSGWQSVYSSRLNPWRKL